MESYNGSKKSCKVELANTASFFNVHHLFQESYPISTENHGATLELVEPGIIADVYHINRFFATPEIPPMVKNFKEDLQLTLPKTN